MENTETVTENITYEEALKEAKKVLRKKKVGRPKLNAETKKKRKIEREAQALLTNQQRAIDAVEKPRIGGRFVSLNPEVTKAKEAREGMLKDIDRGAFISDEDREYIGSDSKKFFERAMQNASTWVEGMLFAKELKPLQHASLSAQQITQEVIVTKKILKWSWDEPTENLIEEAKFVEIESNDRTSDRSSLQADAFTSKDTPELKKV